jgi:hypothetical protein
VVPWWFALLPVLFSPEVGSGREKSADVIKRNQVSSNFEPFRISAAASTNLPGGLGIFSLD